MNPLLLAAILAFAVGMAHSYLGERYILVRLLRREDLPKLLGTDWFTKRTLRGAWHLTTVAWWGSAAQLWFLSAESSPGRERAVLSSLAVVFLISAIITAAASRGKHLAWIVFLAIAILVWIPLR